MESKNCRYSKIQQYNLQRDGDETTEVMGFRVQLKCSLKC